MQRISISFDNKGKHYDGFLDEVHGAGNKVWYLMIDRYYYGRLMFTDQWIFHSNKNDMEDLAELFGEQIMLWYG